MQWPVQHRASKGVYLGSYCHELPLSNLIQMRSILGPNISIISLMYGSTESGTLGVPYNDNILDEFVLQCADFVEFLDVSQAETHENICQTVSTCSFHLNVRS